MIDVPHYRLFANGDWSDTQDRVTVHSFGDVRLISTVAIAERVADEIRRESNNREDPR